MAQTSQAKSNTNSTQGKFGNVSQHSIKTGDQIYKDEDWELTFERICSDLPAKDKEVLMQPRNQEPFTCTRIFESLKPTIQTYTEHGFQKFVSRLDPVLSHVNSFASIIGVFVQSHPEIAGLIWGSLHLTFTLACRAQNTLDSILDFLWKISPVLAIFEKWHQLFPDREFEDLRQCIQRVYEELIRFCLAAIKFLRQTPLRNFFRVLIKPGLEAEFRKREKKINILTANVREEVNAAHMQLVHRQLSTIGNIVGDMQSPQTDETDLRAARIIPHSRNERFFGRASILEKMDIALQPSISEPKQRRFALFGLGGSGKTQVALEYTYSRAKAFRTIIWILASNREKIDQCFTQVAEQFGMDKKISKDPDQAKDFVLQRLSSSTSDYLLVLDNIDDASLTKGIIPHGDQGAIVTTSRDSVMSEDWTRNSQQIIEFTTEEGCGFLRYSLSKAVTLNAEDELKYISETFHGYPLALGQIAGFVRARKCSLKDFIRIYKDKKSSAAIQDVPVTNYHANLVTVWDLSFSSLTERARTILEIFAFLDPDSLSLAFFTNGTESNHDSRPRLQFMSRPLEFLDAIKELRSQSLIRMNPELRTISIHRFFQANIRDRLCQEAAKRDQCFEDAIHLLSIIQPKFLNHNTHWNPQNWQKSRQYLPHIRCLEIFYLQHPSNFKELAPRLAKLVFQGAVYQFEKNHYTSAAEAMRNAILILESGQDIDVLLMCDCYRVEGRIFNESNQPLRTVESSKKAKHYADLAVAQNLIGLSDSRLPRILTGWGNALNQLGQLDEALSMQLEALKLCHGVPSNKSDALTIVQLNWAYVLLRRGDAESAARILRACVDNDPETPYVIYPLGNAYLALGKVDDALSEHVTALNIYTTWFSDDAAVVADSLYKIGEILLLHKSNAEKALPFISKASEIYEDTAYHYDNRAQRARCCRTLGRALKACGNGAKAEENLEKAWGLKEDITGIKGTPEDLDSDYQGLLFYWHH